MAGISPQTSSSLRTALPASADASSSSSSLLQPRAVRPPLPSGPKTHSSSSNSATQTHNQRQDDDDEGAFEIGRGSSPTASVAASSSAASTPQRTPATAMAPTDEGGPDDGPPRTTHLTAAAIKALSLADADGVKGALRLVGLLAADDRLLQAAALWARVQERVAATVAEGGDGDGRVKGLVDAYVADDPARAACLAGLEARAEEARAAMADLEDVSASVGQDGGSIGSVWMGGAPLLLLYSEPVRYPLLSSHLMAIHRYDRCRGGPSTTASSASPPTAATKGGSCTSWSVGWCACACL